MTVDHHPIQIAADVGGTFTDVILIDDTGRLRTRKVPSTPPDFERAVLGAVRDLLTETGTPGASVGRVAHGTTVATNAVLEHRGARTALITTRGFRDVLELRRIRAPQNYDLFFDKPKPLIRRSLRLELTERLSARGEVLTPLAESELYEIKEKLVEEQVESIAVCLLHAYAHPRHEQFVGRFLREHLPEIPVSLSCEVLRERKEYERTATTAVNAYVRPVMRRYLDRMRAGLRQLGIAAPLMMMQSAGGLTPAEEAEVRPVYVLESGPAAGVLGSGYLAGRLGIRNLLSFDMGGTTAKAALIENGRVPLSTEYEVGATMSAGNRLVGGAGELILVPSVDIAEVGAGGGSIAFLDGAGGLHVGPRSAGAVPGPACYQRGGEEPTVTDANVALGYIRAGSLAGGDVRIDSEMARRAVQDRIATPLGLKLTDAAPGIHRIANAQMLRALREVSTQRGRDPRDFELMAYGGSGPVHAATLAAELGLRRIIVPLTPGLFSAVGLLVSGVEHHDVRSCVLPADALTAAALEALRAQMVKPMRDQFRSESIRPDQVNFHCSADVRFRGQFSMIRIGLPDEPFGDKTVEHLRRAFIEEHTRQFGHAAEVDNPIEVVAVRLVGRAKNGSETRALQTPDVPPGSDSTLRRATFANGGTMDVPVMTRALLPDSDRNAIPGPLLIDEYDATIVVTPGIRAWRDEMGNVVMGGAGN